jgi:Pyridoxine biosynthesis enzyme
VFVGSGIFKSAPGVIETADKHRAWTKRAESIVKATTHYQDPDVLAEVSRGLGEAMVGINIDTLQEEELLASRGW